MKSPMEANEFSRPKVLIVDEDETQSDILRRWLAHSGYEPRVATSGLAAIGMVQQEAFDVVITELRLPGLNGLQLLALIKEISASTEVVILSGYGTMEDAIAALREGRAFDFLQKPLLDLSTLTGVIERARARHLREPVKAPTGTGPLSLPKYVEPLTDQETRIVKLLSQGLDNRSIAEQLHFSEKTIRNYLTRIYDKLDVTSRLQAVSFCQQYGLLEHRRMA